MTTFLPTPYESSHLASLAGVLTDVCVVVFIVIAYFVAAFLILHVLLLFLVLKLFFFLVAAVPDIVAAIFVLTFPPDAVFDDYSPALDAPGFVV